MRLVSFILFSVIALASSAPSVFAAENAFGRASAVQPAPSTRVTRTAVPTPTCSGPRIGAAVGSAVSW